MEKRLLMMEFLPNYVEQSDDLKSARMVFSNRTYAVIAIISAIIFWIFLNVFDQTIFFLPVVTFYLPEYAVAGFIVSNITAALLGVVLSMNVYALRHTKSKISVSFFSGSTAGIVSSACASCTSIAFFLVSTFGVAGATTSAFITNYQIPIRLLSVGLLILAYYSVHKKLETSCSANITRKD